MKEFLVKYGKIVVYSIVGLLLLLILLKFGNVIYKNSYSHEKYQYSSKSFQNQVFDSNVLFTKRIKNNGLQGEFKLTFDKKDLTEEYTVKIDGNPATKSIEFSVEGKLNSGDMNVRMIDESNRDVFYKTVKGLNIIEVSTAENASESYKFIFTPNAAMGGDLDIKYIIK